MTRSPHLEQLRDRLLAERERLLRLLGEVEAELSGLAGSRPIERTESAQQEGSLAVLTELDEREWRALAEIETALEKIRTGRYGVCEGCGASIPLARLHARPAAWCCVACQAEQERRERATREQW